MNQGIKMANHCSIKLKMSKTELVSHLKQHFKEKFNLDLLHQENEFNNLILINGLEFPFWLEKEKFYTFDTMRPALSHKANYTDIGKDYNLNVQKNFGFFELACAYSYLFNYMMHYTAKINDTYINSDAVGKIKPFTKNIEKYDTYEA